MRFWLLVALIVFTAYFLMQRMMYPQLNHNSVVDRLSHPLDTRLRYRIGDVDPRFNLSQDQIKTLSQQAADIWHLGTMKSLFVYDPNAQLSINLIYDERQAESSARKQEIRILENTQQYTQNEKQRVQQIQSELDLANRELEIQKTNYQTKVDQYNQLINMINQSQQNLSPYQRQQLEQQKEQLTIDQSQLKQQLDAYNQKVNDLNRQVDQLNSINQQFNQSVDQFNTRFQPRQFDKGVFDGKSIKIYEFESHDDLRVTIAHELGHALGLKHNTDPKALMYPTMKDQDLQNFKLTTADLAMLK
ncbi:matrixin family metalloprotease [Acinetobacter rongchengensis]|uniref:Matrixin n=1 Tax=Acinetobacter rongchengensis TaxID=2419601 RepID=A0A3A8F626_9GAMM|nr:matrixin family metalloprotease [Acinetobacter rongchengensis]RKG36611.1 matrixin [Acinetobacter rongchengensis]